MTRRFDLYLKDIVEAIGRIENYTEGLTKVEFRDDEKTLDATLRNLELIGEAASQLPDSEKSKYSSVQWRKIKDFRNIVAHEYWGIDVDVVWDIVLNKLPVLKQKTTSILDSMDDG